MSADDPSSKETVNIRPIEEIDSPMTPSELSHFAQILTDNSLSSLKESLSITPELKRQLGLDQITMPPRDQISGILDKARQFDPNRSKLPPIDPDVTMQFDSTAYLKTLDPSLRREIVDIARARLNSQLLFRKLDQGETAIESYLSNKTANYRDQLRSPSAFEAAGKVCGKIPLSTADEQGSYNYRDEDSILNDFENSIAEANFE